MRISHFASLSILVAMLAVAATPAAAQPQPAICDVADALDPDHEIAASPRASFTAEVFALAGSDGLAADDPIYELIVQDLAAIDAVAPDVSSLPITPRIFPSGFFVTFVDTATQDAAEAGEIPALECLLELLDVDRETYSNLVPESAAYELDGVVDTLAARALFETLPEVASTSPDFSLLVPPNGCYYSPDGVRRVYFFEEIVGAFPTFGPVRWARAEVGPDGVDVEQTEEFPPPWQDESAACVAGELDGTLGSLPSGIHDIPTLSQLGLLALAALLGLAARRRLALRV